jgi:LPS-assembly protein
MQAAPRPRDESAQWRDTGRDARPANLLRCLVLSLALAACSLILAAASSFAQAPSRYDVGQPVVMTADEINYDEDLQIAIARGNVEIVQGDRVLHADAVSYNRRTNVITASGNVSLREPTGESLFADYFELTDNMREGVAQNFRLLLSDQARLAAVSGRRTDGNLTSARKVVYSPCELCRDDPTRPPLWQIKAARVTHDQNEKQITYNDAWVEVFGVPVFYTPYLSHPDGTVERASGFLAPSYGHSSVLGTLVGVPYLFVLSPSSDLLVEPIYVSSDAPVLAGEYRAKTRTGAFDFNASITDAYRRDDDNNRTEGRELRGHIKGKGRFDINDDWRTGFDVERASDDTYLKRYKLFRRFAFLDSTTLASNGFIEGFRDRNYASANGYAFQGLRSTDDSGLSPIVLPTLDYNFVGDPDAWGGRLSLDANLLSIYRTEGTRDQRASLRGGWQVPFTTAEGHIFTLSAAMQGDLYNVGQIGSSADPFRPTESGVSGRLFPQLSFGWRYPLIRSDGDIRTIIEPVASVVAAPIISGQERLPNEDSRSVEFDDTNLFRLNRFSGLDRVETGQRVNYGLNAIVSRATGGRFTAFVGQSYRLQSETTFPQGSGLADQSSNIVGRVTAAPHEWVQASYRFQLDKANIAAVRSLSSVALGPRALQLAVSHLFLDKSTQNFQPFDIDQVSSAIVGRISENWRFAIRDTRSIGEDKGQLLFGGTLIYENECCIAGVDFTRRFTGDRDNPPDTALVFRIVLRNLGEIKASAF